jgi:hypothetical protein
MIIFSLTGSDGKKQIADADTYALKHIYARTYACMCKIIQMLFLSGNLPDSKISKGEFP